MATDLISTLTTEKNVTPMKACLFNLIIYTHEARRASYFKEIAAATLKKFPCRLIFIQANNEKTDLSIQRTSVNLPAGPSTVSCDQIEIQVSKDTLHRIPYLILPNLVPDMPIYLLWGQNPTEENTILPHLERIAERLIFDSECADDFQSFCHRMLLAKDTHNIEMMDMNWALISCWRDLFATLFNNRKELEILQRTKTVKICYNSLESEALSHTEIQAIYFHGWLVNQLNWTFQELHSQDNLLNLTYRKQNEESIKFSLIAQEHPHLAPGGMHSITILSDQGNEIEIIRDKKLARAIIHISSKELCDLPFTLPLPTLKHGFNFMKELFYQTCGPHYFAMLKKISSLPWSELNK